MGRGLTSFFFSKDHHLPRDCHKFVYPLLYLGFVSVISNTPNKSDSDLTSGRLEGVREKKGVPFSYVSHPRSVVVLQYFGSLYNYL